MLNADFVFGIILRRGVLPCLAFILALMAVAGLVWGWVGVLVVIAAVALRIAFQWWRYR